MGFVAAADTYAKYCIPKGQVLDFGATCNPAMGKLTGYVETCVQLNNGKICPAGNQCNSLGLSCTNNLTGTFGDINPPELEIISPQDGAVYTQTSFYLNVESDEAADISYLDLINGRGRWTKVCNDCTSYNKRRTFKEGLNDLLFKAEDKSGQESYYNVSFFVDSKKPKINKAEPKKGFANGEFYIEFTELNPTSLILNYGNQINGFRTGEFDIDGDCVLVKTKYQCNIDLDVNDYDGESLTYWANLTDIAGNSATSKPIILEVDLTEPVINSFNYTVKGKKVVFNMSIYDPNFEEVTYIDTSSTRFREIILCPSLKNGYCTKAITLSSGNHDLTVQVYDKAGNSIGVPGVVVDVA